MLWRHRSKRTSKNALALGFVGLVLFQASSQIGFAEELTAAEKVERFTKLLKGKELVGKFTVLGKEEPAKDESYTITGVQKLDKESVWLIYSRIRYGDKDVTVPVPVEVKWAGDTPVVSLTEVTLPGLGTFSSRVVFYNGKYAGTWTHGKVGGHLFGTIGEAREKAKSSNE